jgi:N-acetylmuramoyl-L-alanine amidase
LTFRRFITFPAALSSVLVLLLGHTLSSQAPSATQVSVLTREGRRPLATVTVNGQEFVALDDLASMFQLSIREEALGNITVSYKGKTIVLTPDQALASVAGRLVSLPASPTRSGRRWLVPIEFVGRALAPIYDVPLDLRKPAHLLIVGDLRVPRINIRYDPLGTAGRLTIDATPRTASTVSQDNEHVTIRFDADALDPPSPLLPPQPPTSLVQNARIADPVTIAVDLAPRTTVRAVSQPTDTGTRLVIDLAAAQTTDQQPQQPSPTPAPATPEAPPAPLAPAPAGLRTLVIDPGHGGEDEGVKGSGGTKEKDLVFAASRRLKAAVEGRLGIRVLLTREDDRNIPLDERSALANNNKADLFISLHANASFRQSTSGLLIVTAHFGSGDSDVIEHKPFTGERLPAFGGGARDVELVPWSEAQVGYLARSEAFARLLEQTLQGRLPIATPPSERAPIRVLETANMPAVLIEIGYLSNPDQERQMSAGEFQSAFTQGVLEAIVRFRDVIAGAPTQ